MEPERLQSAYHEPKVVGKALVIVAILVGIGFIALGACAAWTHTVPEWTGFGPGSKLPDDPLPRTLWDWLELIIVPVAVAGGVAWLNRVQKQAEDARAKDRLRQAELVDYYGRLTDLIIEHKLGSTDEKDGARTIAHALTLTVLPGLDGRRKGQIVRFLHEAGLINGKTNGKPVINLAGADASKANLQRMRLRDAVMVEFNLAESDLTETDLRGTDLAKSDLSGAVLLNADLSRTKLTGARLIGADLTRAKLNESVLAATDLTDAILNDADLTGARYWSTTRWPVGFNPTAAGAILVELGQSSRENTDI
jgi:uncharacterized protein YjbI with pentapeptide repeats